jgi:hypothetical protein
LFTYWMLMAVPWPRFMTQPPHCGTHHLPASAAMGTLFDMLSVPAWRLRRWAVNWSRWADGRLRALARDWRTACGLPLPAVRPSRRLHRARTTADDDGDPRAIGLQDDEFIASDDEEEEEDEEELNDDFDDESTTTSGEGDATASLGTDDAEDGASVDEDAYLAARFGKTETRDLGGAARRGSGTSGNSSAGSRRRGRTAINHPGRKPGGTARAEHSYNLRPHPHAQLPHPESHLLVAGSLDPAADADAELPA